jgi:PAS domain S-box-containing protein
MRVLEKFDPAKVLASKRGNWVSRYGLGILAVLAAFAIRFAMSPWLGSRAPFILFVPAIMIAAWTGGLVPALLASLITFFLADVFFIPPEDRWSFSHAHEIVATVVYVFSAFVVAELMQAVRRSREEAVHRAELLEKEVEQRKRAQQALYESKECLRAILENSPAMIFLKDAEGRYLVCNREFAAITHRPSSEIVGKTDHDLFEPGQAAAFRSNDQKVLERGAALEFEEVAPHDNGPHTSLVHRFPLRDATGKIYAVGGIATDITERKRMEEALRESEEKYRSLYNNTPVMLHSIGRNGELLSVSNFWLNMLGYKRGEVIGRKSLEFLTPGSQKFAEKKVLPEYFKTGVCMDVPYQMVKKNGEIMDVLLSAIAEKDGEGNVVRSLAVIVDVTAQKRAERALRANEERLRILAETAVDAIVSADVHGNIIQFNPAAEKIFGRVTKEMLGQSISVLIPKRYRAACEHGVKEFSSTGKADLIGRTVELAGLRNDGTEFPLELSLSAWESSEGKFFTAVLRDITERKHAQETVRRNEELLRMTTEAANVYVWNWDLINDRLESSGMSRMTGNRVPLSSEQIEKFAPPEDRAKVWREVDRCLRENRELNLEYRVVWADGSIHWQLSRGRPHFENGRAVRLSGISMDITERKNAEEALRRSEALLRMTTEGANVHVWTWDIVKDIVECPQLARIVGKPSGINLRAFLDYVYPDDRAAVKIALDKCLQEKSEFNAEYRIIWTDGSVHWQFSRGQPVFDHARAIRLSGISMDFTARRKAEEALRRSEGLLRITTEGANVGLWNWDVVNDVLEWNPVEYQQCALHENAEMRLQTFLDRVHPDDRDRVKAAMETCLRERRELSMEYRVVWPDGTVRWRLCKGTPAYIDDRPVRFSGMSLDITERKKAQEILKRQAELLNLAQVLVFDMEDKILLWNHEAERLYGYTATEALGKNRLALLHSQAAIPPSQIKESLQSQDSWSGELTRLRKGGAKVFVAVHWVVCKDDQNRPVAILESANNITALKKTEADLQQAQQDLALHAKELEQRVEQRTAELQRSLKDMESFCYTIAHDLRAPLRAMSGFSHSLAEDFGPALGETGLDYCKRIHSASARMSQLISDLLVYGRLSHRELPVQSVDLLAEIQKVLVRAAPQIQERQAEIELDAPLPEVCGDAPVIDQILENLIANAVKFVPAERRPHVHIFAQRHNGNIRLCIEDNGIGILREHWGKIFRPFERLQTGYPGTGIGLAIVQRGIEKMGGHVGVESIPEQGSRFWVELPERCERP